MSLAEHGPRVLPSGPVGTLPPRGPVGPVTQECARLRCWLLRRASVSTCGCVLHTCLGPRMRQGPAPTLGALAARVPGGLPGGQCHPAPRPAWGHSSPAPDLLFLTHLQARADSLEVWKVTQEQRPVVPKTPRGPFSEGKLPLGACAATGQQAMFWGQASCRARPGGVLTGALTVVCGCHRTGIQSVRPGHWVWAAATRRGQDGVQASCPRRCSLFLPNNATAWESTRAAGPVGLGQRCSHLGHCWLCPSSPHPCEQVHPSAVTPLRTPAFRRQH